MPADGGPVKPLTSDAFNNTRPSWSLDKQWIYFASDRTGDWQIWKMPSAGGKPEQITWGGGRDPVVSWDGRRVYYAKSAPILGIWEVPAEGGQEVQIVFGRGREMNFDVAENGIFMMDPSAKPQATVEMFSFASRQIVPVARLPPGVRLQPALLRRHARRALDVVHPRRFLDERHRDAARVSLKTDSSRATPARA